MRFLEFAAAWVAMGCAVATTYVGQNSGENKATGSRLDSSVQTSEAVSEVPVNELIDYPEFLELTHRLQSIREQRRIPVEEFMRMASEPDTIILDSRSKASFDQIHVEGAVHLNFSEFSEPKLSSVIPNKSTRILIYCNNNFVNRNLNALTTKSPALALNIPTFINLVGYGYENIYELADVLEVDDPRIPLTGSEPAIRMFAIAQDATQSQTSQERSGK